jgi:uncharacterized CHY-type Zn-finger protein
MAKSNLENNENFLAEQMNNGEYKICPFCSARFKPDLKRINTVYMYVFKQCLECERYLVVKTTHSTIKKVYFKQQNEVTKKIFDSLMNKQESLF